MAVIGGGYATIIPIFRGEGILRNPVGRWTYNGFATGDATGGDVTITANLSQLKLVFGSFALFNLTFYNFVVNVTLTNVVLNITPSERSSSGALALQYSIDNPGFWYSPMGTMYDFSTALFAPSDSSALGSGVGMAFTPNTDTKVYNFRCGGLVFDERFL